MKIIAKLPKIFYSSACSSDLRQYHIRITISDFPGCNESFTSSNSLPVANSPTTGFLATGTSLYPNVARRAEIRINVCSFLCKNRSFTSIFTLKRNIIARFEWPFQFHILTASLLILTSQL